MIGPYIIYPAPLSKKSYGEQIVSKTHKRRRCRMPAFERDSWEDDVFALKGKPFEGFACFVDLSL